MGWRLIRQPNGNLARFSEVVDDFTDYDLTDEEAFELCRDYAGATVAHMKIRNADSNPNRFDEALEIIQGIHGTEVALSRSKLMTEQPKAEGE